MTPPDLSQLRAALDSFTRRFDTIRLDVTADGRNHFMGSLSSDEYAAYQAVEAAARFALPLLPEKCGTCGGRGWTWTDDRENYGEQNTCDDCHGGLVWDPETVKRIARILYDADGASVTIFGPNGVPLPSHEWDSIDFDMKDIYLKMAVAVLAALNSPEMK